MAWGESAAWISGVTHGDAYRRLLEEATDAPQRNAGRKKIVKPADMPWEMSRQGLLKHLISEDMNTRMETVDAYLQILPPGTGRPVRARVSPKLRSLSVRQSTRSVLRPSTSRRPRVISTKRASA